MTKESVNHQESQGVNTRNFNKVIDDDLRVFLQILNTRIPQDKEVFSNSDIQRISMEDINIGDIKIEPHVSHTMSILGKVRAQKIVPYVTRMEKNKPVVYYTREGVLAINAVRWEHELSRKRPNKPDWKETIKSLRSKIGQDNIREWILLPDIARRFPGHYSRNSHQSF